MKYFRPILDKKDPPEDKDQFEDKELPNPSGSLSKVIPSSSIANCNAEVTKVLKQAKLSVTKSCYTKLTPPQRYEIGKKGTEMGVTRAIRYYKKVPRFIINRTNCEAIKKFVSGRISQTWMQTVVSLMNCHIRNMVDH